MADSLMSLNSKTEQFFGCTIPNNGINGFWLMKKARYEEKLNEVRSCGQFSTIENCTETAVPEMRKELFAKSSKIHTRLIFMSLLTSFQFAFLKVEVVIWFPGILINFMDWFVVISVHNVEFGGGLRGENISTLLSTATWMTEVGSLIRKTSSFSMFVVCTIFRKFRSHKLLIKSWSSSSGKSWCTRGCDKNSAFAF